MQVEFGPLQPEDCLWKHTGGMQSLDLKGILGVYSAKLHRNLDTFAFHPIRKTAAAVRMELASLGSLATAAGFETCRDTQMHEQRG